MARQANRVAAVADPSVELLCALEEADLDGAHGEMQREAASRPAPAAGGTAASTPDEAFA